MNKKLSSLLLDKSRDMRERLFRIVSSIGIFFCTVLFIIGFWLEESPIEQIVLAICIVCFTLITFLCNKYNKIQLGALLISILFSFLLLPVTFFCCGGLYGGAPVWFIISFVYICLLLTGATRIIMLILYGINIAFCYYFSFIMPRLVVQHTLTTAYLDSAVAVVILGIFLSLLMIFQNRIYEDENNIVIRQKKEIEELNQAQNRFFSSMSHEIRTPINTIIGLNEMTLRANVSQEIAENATYIQGASNMLLTLINDILDMSKMESGKMEIIPANYEMGILLSDLVNIFWVRAKSKNLELHIDADPSLPSMLYGDEVRIKQILINLLNNAIKYTSEGSVKLSIRGEAVAANKMNIVFTVSDTGMGIKKESIPYLFDAFQRVDEKMNRMIEGTGLGLSIVKNLVDLMGGTITVNSVYTKGSTFAVTVPQDIIGDETLGVLNIETRSVLKSRANYKQSFEAPEAKILIVDDNEMNLRVAGKLLAETKVQIDLAKSGEECLSMTQNVHYDGILMDHIMPEMDGVETLRRIREQQGGMSKDTPVIALTANASSDSQMIYRKAGFDGYLAKPVNGTLLEAAVLKLLPEELITEKNGEDFRKSVDDNILFDSGRERVPVLITTESVCDLPEELIEQYKIPVLPYYVITPEGHFQDGKEVFSDALVEYLADNSGDRDIHSVEPESRDYENFFAENLTKADCIIHISMASKAGFGYERAKEVAREFGNVEVIDCGHLSSGMGLIILEAVKMAQQGASREMILQRLVELRKEVSTSFIVESTQTLRNVGRISPVIHKLCETILIHPVVCLRKSHMRVKSIYMGRQQNAVHKYIKRILRNKRQIDPEILFITYVGLSLEELQLIQEETLKIVPFKNIYLKKASAAIACNCGPGTFGLLYKKKNGGKS